MEEIHRKSIMENVNILIKHTNYTMVLNECIENKILTESMADKIEKMNDTDNNKYKSLLKKITTRGPTAFQDFLLCLDKLKYWDIEFMLSNSCC